MTQVWYLLNEEIYNNLTFHCTSFKTVVINLGFM